MKKALLLIACVLFLATQVSFGRRPLANEDKAGLYVRSIEQVLRLDAEQVDLATAALIISEQWSDNVYGRKYLARLDDMAFEIRDKLQDNGLKINYKVVGVINEYLFDELGYESVPEANDPNDLFLHCVMDRKRGYCLSLSILYLSLAERLGLPLYGVVVPGHFFVRYDDGQVRFNIETTSKGGSAPDEHYINKFKVPQGDNSIYMMNLNKLQTLGCFFNNLGNTYSDIGDIDAALMAFENACQINPSLAECHTNLGNIYLKKDKIEDAIYEYQRALEINPDDAITHNNLGNAYSKLWLLNDAISQYQQSLELDPNFIDAYKNLAGAYCKKQMYKRARLVLREAINRQPKNASLYSQLGNVYSQMDKFEQAIFQYKKALKIKGDLVQAHYGLGICYNKLGLIDDEIQAYQSALSYEPNMVAALANLGNAYFNLQEYDRAIEQYKKLILLKPDDITIYYNLGAAYFNKGDNEQAIVHYKRAIEIEPKLGDAHKGLGLAFYRLENYELAAKHLKIAQRLGTEIDKDLLAAIEDKLR